MKPHGVSKARQFAAVLQKNFILQFRGRRSFLGLGGLPALLLQVSLPALFFALMCIPKYYIQPYEHPVYLQQSESDIDTRWWAGASPYEGPAFAAGGNARIAFVPDTPEAASLVRRLAMAVSCPSEPYKRICSAASITTFSCLFGVQGTPPQCQNATACMMSPECYQPALSENLLLLKDESAVQTWLQDKPHSLDAVVVFPQAAAAAAAKPASVAVKEDIHLISPAPRLYYSSSSGSTGTSSSSSRAASQGLKQLLGCGAPGPPDGDGLLLDYVIRMNSSDVPPTQLLRDLFDVSPGIMPLPGNLLWEYREYWFFVNLQLSIDRALLGGQQLPGEYPAPLTVKVKPFPWPAKQEDLGAASAAAFFNLLLVYAFMAPTRAVVGSIVREKELRLREGMRILGLSEAAYWWSWIVTHWLTMAASGLLCAVVGLYPFRHSSLPLMLTFYWLFSAALISFSYFLSTLFSASRVAGTATQFIYALSMIPGFLLPFVRPYGGISWYIAGLSPTSAASLFAAALVNWERLAAGVNADTMWLPVAAESSFCVVSVLWLLAVDVLLFAVLTWYCDKVLPQPHGQTLAPFFPFMPSYWRQSVPHSSTAAGAGENNELTQPLLGHTNAAKHSPNVAAVAAGSNSRRTATAAAVDCQTVTPGEASTAADGIGGGGAPAYVRVCGLRKVFHSSEGTVRVAVDDLKLQMCAGRITALLGHNGAGKTTTIHMLTGMLQPTSGTAYIGGHDIRTNMAAIRQSLGICPQFDILWPDITVREHLQLYAVIKGATYAEASTQAQQAAAQVGLSDKMKCLASELSGGQRRKLSVAIAFLGRPAVVFLDEPTSGMDPYSRRATWDVIRRRRHESVIVLTTHSMEEADLLCDDIHIMAEGRLAASGTPLSLKAQYGVGYTLTVVLQQPQQHATQQQQQQQQQHQQQQHSIQQQAPNASPKHAQQEMPPTDTRQGAGPLSDIYPLQHSVGGRGSSSSLSSSKTGALARSHGRAAQAQAAADHLMQLVQQHIPSAQLLSAAGYEVSIRLPKENAAAFPAALRALDGALGQLGVSSYGLSVTTLEEVFLAIADQAVAVRPNGSSGNASLQQQQQHQQHQHDSVVHAVNGAHAVAQGTQDKSRSNASKPTATSAVGAGVGLNGVDGGVAQADLERQQSCSIDSQEFDVLAGAALYMQQFKALFVKRAVCARRDRLAVVTQLLVPLLLVLLAMAVSTLETQRPQQPPLQLSRSTCLMGRPALFAAAAGLRQKPEAQGFMDGYSRGDLTPTPYTHLYHGSSGPALNLTLEGQLLNQWSSGSPSYDALFLQDIPPVDQLLTSLSGPGPSLTLLVNQSAVSALPAALNQATSALLRLIVAAGGAKGSTRHTATAAVAHNMMVTEQMQAGDCEHFAEDAAAEAANGTNYSDRASSSSSSSGRVSSRPGSIPRRFAAASELSTALGDLQPQVAAASSGNIAGEPHRTTASPPGVDASAGTSSRDRGCSHAGRTAILRTESSIIPGAKGRSGHTDIPGGGHLPSCHPVITAVSSPLPLMLGEKAQRVRQDAGALMLVLCMTLAASVLSASFVVFLVREADNNSKHLQMVSGAHPTAYWLANFCWDMVNYCLPAAGMVLLVYAYHQPQLSGIRLVAMALLLLAFGGAGINLTYLCHFMFGDEMKALQRLNTVYFLTGYLGFLTTWILGLIGTIMGKPSLGAASDRTKAVLRLLSPHYCFAQGLYDISNTAPGSGALPIPGLPHGPTNPFCYSVLGSAVLHLLVQTLVFGAAAVLLDIGVMQLLRRAWLGMHRRTRKHHSSSAAGAAGSPSRGMMGMKEGMGAGDDVTAGHGLRLSLGGEDADVAAERLAVKAGQGDEQAMVVLDGISKAYQQDPPVVAVKGLWLRVWPGECFGLLGVNGAGKTTTFKVLTGEVTPDTGDALVSHFSVLTQLAAARQRLGYCPQFEALPAAMTGREVLTMYAQLRGMSGSSRIAAEVDQLLAQLGLVQYADVTCGSYSGGNKRKLSVAVALVGSPPLVLLDEPSTGMDPSARRFLWRVLQTQVLSAGRTIILTSHSMEEVDALASRLAIMAAGSARCLGTPQHLKSKFGDGYTLELRLGVSTAPSQQGATASSAAAAAGSGSVSRHVESQAETEPSPRAEERGVQPSSSVAQLAAATDRAEHHFESVMPGTVLLEKEPGRLLLRLPLGSRNPADPTTQDPQQQQQHSDVVPVASLSDVFEAVEAARGPLGITEYSLAQSSLERVFLALAKAASHAANGD